MRIPLTISAVGVPGFGVISTVAACYSWLATIPAGARLSASAASASGSFAACDEGLERRIGRLAVRRAAPVGLLSITIVLALPEQTLRVFLDPSDEYSAWVLRGSLIFAISLAFLAVPGAVRLGVLTTRGRTKEQNLALLANLLITTGATWIGAVNKWEPAFFVAIWLVALAAPALPVSAWRACMALPRGRSRRPRGSEANELNSLGKSGLWISLSQQFGNGLDLIVITVFLGSVPAAQYALVFRLMQVVVAPMMGVGPVLTKLAGEARASCSRADRRASRRAIGTVLALQSAVLLTFGLSANYVVRLLSGGELHADGALLALAVVWCALEVARRAAIAVTATPRAMSVWRRTSLWAVGPNVALTLLLTWSLGVVGPLLATVVVGVAQLSATLIMVRPELREAG